ncbi:transcription factor [Phyllobacterium brassicacearum]|uniref:Transcription factor n=1 Tax=Phyllobacterium brassicacearum TaxID=314235 RepID=A0A2P7BWC1_9HYPH|nr:type II toxin-antitoxin system VapB family antitoxin [Phyllobacterium brassicacearum]PSH70764.1 transcription factor [Phyllobacterium brassicacearum]TDQ35753.1 antitoxin VapB [Phyllobacterium brassicacearum]
MPLYIKDDRIDELARRYQTAIKATSKTEAVKKALQRALAEQNAQLSLADMVADFARALRVKGEVEAGLPADKQFRDSLYD